VYLGWYRVVYQGVYIGCTGWVYRVYMPPYRTIPRVYMPPYRTIPQGVYSLPVHLRVCIASLCTSGCTSHIAGYTTGCTSHIAGYTTGCTMLTMVGIPRVYYAHHVGYP